MHCFFSQDLIRMQPRCAPQLRSPDIPVQGIGMVRERDHITNHSHINGGRHWQFCFFKQPAIYVLFKYVGILLESHIQFCYRLLHKH